MLSAVARDAHCLRVKRVDHKMLDRRRLHNFLLQEQPSTLVQQCRRLHARAKTLRVGDKTRCDRGCRWLSGAPGHSRSWRGWRPVGFRGTMTASFLIARHTSVASGCLVVGKGRGGGNPQWKKLTALVRHEILKHHHGSERDSQTSTPEFTLRTLCLTYVLRTPVLSS